MICLLSLVDLLFLYEYIIRKPRRKNSFYANFTFNFLFRRFRKAKALGRAEAVAYADKL